MFSRTFNNVAAMATGVTLAVLFLNQTASAQFYQQPYIAPTHNLQIQPQAVNGQYPQTSGITVKSKGADLYESFLKKISAQGVSGTVVISHNVMVQKALKKMLQEVAKRKFRNQQTGEFDNNRVIFNSRTNEIDVLILPQANQVIRPNAPSYNITSYSGQTAFLNNTVRQISLETGISEFHLYEYLLVGATEAFGDKYTRYLPFEERQAFEEAASGEFVGAGMDVTLQDEFIKVLGTMEGSPAQKANLQEGDLITHVDGTNIKGLPLSDSTKLIKGPIGTSVTLTIKRADQTFNQVIKRAKIKSDPTQGSELIGQDIAYLKLSNFTDDSFSAVESRLKQLQAEAKQEIDIVFDLRGNPGGNTFQTHLIWDLLFEDTEGEKDIVYASGETSNDNTIRMDQYVQGKIQYGDIVVLIDQHSGSSSEIIAAIAQDHGVKVFGNGRTYGKGLFQTVTGSSKVTGGYFFAGKRRKTNHVCGVTASNKVICNDFRDAELTSFQYEKWGNLAPLHPSQTRTGDKPETIHKLKSEYSGVLTPEQVEKLPEELVRRHWDIKSQTVVSVFDAVKAAALAEIAPETYSQYLIAEPYVPKVKKNPTLEFGS